MDGNDDEKPGVARLDTWRQEHGRRADAGNTGQPFTLHHRDRISALGHPGKGGSAGSAQGTPDARRDSPTPAMPLPAGDEKIVRGRFTTKHKPAYEAWTPPDEGREAEQPQQKPHILLIEPEIRIRNQLQDALESKGCAVTVLDRALPGAYQMPGVTETSADGRAYDLVIYGDVTGTSNPDGDARRHDKLLNNRFGIPVIMLTDDDTMQMRINHRSRYQRPRVMGFERYHLEAPGSMEWSPDSVKAIVDIAKGMLDYEKQQGQSR